MRRPLELHCIHSHKNHTHSIPNTNTELTSWNSLRRSYACWMPLSAHRARMAGRYCRNTAVSTMPCTTETERVSNAIIVSPLLWFAGSPQGIWSFSLASTRTLTPLIGRKSVAISFSASTVSVAYKPAKIQTMHLLCTVKAQWDSPPMRKSWSFWTTDSKHYAFR